MEKMCCVATPMKSSHYCRLGKFYNHLLESVFPLAGCCEGVFLNLVPVLRGPAACVFVCVPFIFSACNGP